MLGDMDFLDPNPGSTATSVNILTCWQDGKIFSISGLSFPFCNMEMIISFFWNVLKIKQEKLKVDFFLTHTVNYCYYQENNGQSIFLRNANILMLTLTYFILCSKKALDLNRCSQFCQLALLPRPRRPSDRKNP